MAANLVSSMREAPLAHEPTGAKAMQPLGASRRPPESSLRPLSQNDWRQWMRLFPTRLLAWVCLEIALPPQATDLPGSVFFPGVWRSPGAKVYVLTWFLRKTFRAGPKSSGAGSGPFMLVLRRAKPVNSFGLVSSLAPQINRIPIK